MENWKTGPVLRVGGVVAVAFADESLVAVGSHSGLGLFDVQSGALVRRISDPDGNYGWYSADPPAVRYETTDGVKLLPAAGLWGGDLATGTRDGWTIHPTDEGAVLEHPEHTTVRLLDPEEQRAIGFAPGGNVAILATTSAVRLLVRVNADDDPETVTLWRPTGPQELDLVRSSGWRRWPARLPGQPIFYPVLNEDYAQRIARDWNLPASGVGYVTRFQVRRGYLDQFGVHQVGGETILEYWIPAERLEEFNDNIVGLIELVETFGIGLDALAAALSARIPAWTAEGVRVGELTWRDRDARWPKPVVVDRSSIAFPESLGLILTLSGDATGDAMTQAQVVFWMGGWADVDAVIRDVVFTDAPQVTDVDAGIAVAESVVARLLALTTSYPESQE